MCHLNLFVSTYGGKFLRIGVAVGLSVGVLVQAQPQAQTQWLDRTSHQSHHDGPTQHSIDLRALANNTSSPLKGEVVVYPSSQVAFICGPQLKARSRLNPFPWFDLTQIKYGHIHGRETPIVPPRVLSGKVSARPESSVVIGKGTRFRSEVDPLGPDPYYSGWLRIKDNAIYRDVKVASVESDARLTLASDWRFAPVSDAQADTYHYDTTQASWNYDHYYGSSYYDTALVEYINYYRTGDPTFLAYARKMADARWASQYIDFGTVTGGPNHLPPRSQAFAGLMLRALDGKPEYWDYLYRDVRSTFDHWLKQRRNDRSLYYDIREDGYAQLYAVMLAHVLPNQYPLYPNGTLMPSKGMATDGARKRAELLADAEDIAVNFFGRLQRADGSWRWNIDSENLVNTEQPFMVGLYLESAILLHQLTLSAAVKESLHEQIVRACRHLYRDAFRGKEIVKDMPQYRWRGMWYFWGGGKTSDPMAYERGEGERLTRGDPGMIRQIRHLNSTIHHAFGYAYYITGDVTFKQMGDDIFDASYGDHIDGLHSLADSPKAKDYDMNFRSSGRYLVWRLSDGKAEALMWSPPTNTRKPSSTTQPGAPVRLSAATTPAQHISAALSVASQFSTDSVQGDEIRNLVNQIETALRAFRIERHKFVAPDRVIEELQAALGNARTALSMAESASGSSVSVRLRVEWAAARLKRAVERVEQK